MDTEIKTPSGPFKTPTRQHLTSGALTPRAYNRTPRSATGRRADLMKTPGDRFIPNRAAMDIEFSRYKVASRGENTPSSQTAADRNVIRDKLLALKGHNSGSRVLSFKQTPSLSSSVTSTPDKYEYWSPYKTVYHCSSGKKKVRKFPKAADKVLDAPNLTNDFYLNVLDWGKTGHLAVALGGAVYVLDGVKGSVSHLCDLDTEQLYVSSLQWNASGKYLAVGCSDAEIQLWDVNCSKLVRRLRTHQSQVNSLAWNSKSGLLSSGCQHGSIHNYDPRMAQFHIATLKAHSMDVCGLKWSPNGRFLASGGNDNMINIWDSSSRAPWSSPALTLKEHSAAVKALSWCPWQSSLLASGGGTADKTIRLWNACNGHLECKVETGSQVSGLLWSSAHHELISSHGQPSNHLKVWQCEQTTTTTLTGLAELRGHEDRILHLTMSPDGQTVASAGADETLRFWKCFEKNNLGCHDNITPKLGLARYIR